jgi:hypothetical protein
MSSHIWDRIVRFVRAEDRVGGKDISLVSKQHLAVAKPLFYRQVNVKDARRFLRTILIRSELAGLVRQLSLAHRCWAYNKPSYEDSSLLNFWDNSGEDDTDSNEEEEVVGDGTDEDIASHLLYANDVEEEAPVTLDDGEENGDLDKDARLLGPEFYTLTQTKARQLGFSPRWPGGSRCCANGKRLPA